MTNKEMVASITEIVRTNARVATGQAKLWTEVRGLKNEIRFLRTEVNGLGGNGNHKGLIRRVDDQDRRLIDLEKAKRRRAWLVWSSVVGIVTAIATGAVNWVRSVLGFGG